MKIINTTTYFEKKLMMNVSKIVGFMLPDWMAY